MRQDVPDVNFPPAVVDGRDQTGLVAPDIENGEFPDLVGMRKNRTDFLDAGKAPAAHLFEPMDQTGSAIRVQLGKVIQSLSSDDMHAGCLSLAGNCTI
jgi:hypothetical protein